MHQEEAPTGREPDELARKIIDAVSDKQAEDVLLLDIRKVASFPDYFVIASGATVRQSKAIIDSVEEAVSGDGVKPMGREGEPDSGWVLIHYGAALAHIFAPEQRAFYGPECLGQTATPVVRIQ